MTITTEIWKDAAQGLAEPSNKKVVVVDFFAAFVQMPDNVRRKDILTTLDDATLAGHQVIISILREETDLEMVASLSLRMLFPEDGDIHGRFMKQRKFMFTHDDILQGARGILRQDKADIYVDASGNYWNLPCETHIQVQKEGALPALRQALSLAPPQEPAAPAPAPHRN